MRSSATSHSQLWPPLVLAAIALAALGASLLLAFVVVTVPHALQPMPIATPIATSVARAPAAPTPAAVIRAQPASANRPAALGVLLAPWALGADAIALLGLVGVLVVRRART